MRPEEFRLSFLCSNRAAALIAPGLNTLLFQRQQLRFPTSCAGGDNNNDGIVNISGTNGNRRFCRGYGERGATGTITASADTGSQRCRCKFMPDRPGQRAVHLSIGPSATTQINANATPTFGIFLQGNGNVPFDPATNRIFVRFKDSGAVTRGSTSVAVRTQ